MTETPLTSGRRAGFALVLVVGIPAACVQVDPRPDFDRARQLVEQSTGRAEVFDPLGAGITEQELDALLADGLSLDEALRLALVNNRELQAEFQEIGVAHADWAQSRLPSNPSIDVLLRFPTDGGRSMLEAIVGVELLELWRIPVREQEARRNLEATILRIARRAGERLAETRQAYYEALAAEELYRVALENEQLVARSLEAVVSLHEAGAADALEESLARGPLLSAQLALRTARIQAANGRRELAKRLSIERPVQQLLLTDSLPGWDRAELEPELLVQRALESRLDLRAVALTIEALEQRVRLERRRAWGDVAVGPAVERPAVSGSTLVGPSLSVTPPLFDRNQAQVARAGFELEQMVKLHEAARVAVAQDVRSSVDRVNTAARSLAFYEQELLPQSESSLALARESYAVGGTTLLALVELQRQVLEARRGHVVLRLEAASSASELERVLGAPLEGSAGDEGEE